MPRLTSNADFAYSLPHHIATMHLAELRDRTDSFKMKRKFEFELVGGDENGFIREEFTVTHQFRRIKRMRIGREVPTKFGSGDAQEIADSGILSNLQRVQDSVVEIMLGEVFNATIQALGIRATIDCFHLGYFSAEAMSVVINAILNHADKLDIQFQGCCALLIFFRSQSQNIKITPSLSYAFETLIFHLFECLEIHFHSSPFQIVCLDLLHLLANSFPDVIRVIASGESSAVGILFKMRASNPLLQRLIMALLSLIVENDAGRRAIFNQGGVEHVVQTIRTSEEDPMILCNATAVLSWLLHSKHDADEMRQPSSLRLHHDLVKIMLTILKRHLKDAKVFGNAVCVLVAYFARNVDAPVRSKKTILFLMLQGLVEHNLNAKVTRCSLRLLRSLTMECSQCQHTVLHHHLDAINNAMQVHMNDARIQEEAIGSLGNICVCPYSQAYLSRSNTIESVLSCQEAHRKSQRLQEIAFWFQQKLLHYSTGKADVAFGGTEENLQNLFTNRSEAQ